MLIIGCGYTGRLLAARLLLEGKQVTGVVSSRESALHLERMGVPPVVADLDDPGADLPLDGHDHIWYLAPPPGTGAADTRLQIFLDRLRQADRTPRIVYTGTTGVYGDCGGEWVDENRPLNPTTDRARRRADAERRLRLWAAETGGSVVVLRVAGIYGPGRLPVAYLKKGAPVLRSEDAPWSNRIHVDDLVTACLAAMDRGRGVYNVADGRPCTMPDYYNRLADLLELPHPPRITWQQAEESMSRGLLSFLRENRRIDSRRLREELDVALRYPGYEEGLPASL
jgi:nucleoside-diphosphate-sugar epimerase